MPPGGVGRTLGCQALPRRGGAARLGANSGRRGPRRGNPDPGGRGRCSRPRGGRHGRGTACHRGQRRPRRRRREAPLRAVGCSYCAHTACTSALLRIRVSGRQHWQRLFRSAAPAALCAMKHYHCAHAGSTRCFIRFWANTKIGHSDFHLVSHCVLISRQPSKVACQGRYQPQIPLRSPTFTPFSCLIARMHQAHGRAMHALFGSGTRLSGQWSGERTRFAGLGGCLQAQQLALLQLPLGLLSALACAQPLPLIQRPLPHRWVALKPRGMPHMRALCPETLWELLPCSSKGTKRCTCRFLLTPGQAKFTGTDACPWHTCTCRRWCRPATSTAGASEPGGGKCTTSQVPSLLAVKPNSCCPTLIAWPHHAASEPSSCCTSMLQIEHGYSDT